MVVGTHRADWGTEAAQVVGKLEEETGKVSSDLVGQAVGDRTSGDLLDCWSLKTFDRT